MVDDNEEQYEGEEGEYHFSDEQVNYDEVESPADSKTKAASIKDSIINKMTSLSSRRRVVVAGVVFVILMGVVYKMLSPSSSSAQRELTQFAQGTTSSPRQQAQVRPTTPPPRVQTQQPQVRPTQETTQPAQVASSVPPVREIDAIEAISPLVGPGPAPQQQVASSTGTATAATTTTPPYPTVTAPVPGTVSASDEKLKALEAQSSAVIKLLQNEYSQKMTDFEMQSNMVKSKIDDMTKRMNRMEKSLSQITELLKSDKISAKSKRPQGQEVEIVEERVFAPSVAYTVQAVIPGRAWLKSDAGDTVTVAEGDILREYGRISKIDPYDGVVEINTGHKIIALSYGMTVN